MSHHQLSSRRIDRQFFQQSAKYFLILIGRHPLSDRLKSDQGCNPVGLVAFGDEVFELVGEVGDVLG